MPLLHMQMQKQQMQKKHMQQQQKQKQKRITRRKQRGGYYFSVYHGIQNAGILFPLVFRQAHRLLSRKTIKRRGHSLKDRKTPGYR